MNTPRISIIVAMSDNRVIGSKGEIPWNIPGEQKRVRDITTPHPLIMGRKTHVSIGRILPNRLNIVVTSDKNYKVEGGEVAHSLNEAIEIAASSESHRYSSSEEIEREVTSDDSSRFTRTINPESEIFIFGGGKLYEQAMDIVDRLYLTIVHTEVEGDAYFPEYSEFTKEIEREEKEFEGLKYTYLTLER